MDEENATIIPGVHYVCIGGCGLVSETQKKCLTPGCWRARNPLGECNCEDNKHLDFYKIYNPEMLNNEKTSS